jgi:hypothetical protein
MSARRSNNSLYAEGRTGDKPCLVTIDTGASVTDTRLDISAGLHERELTLERRSLRTWVFSAKITDEFILWLDGLHAHDVFMDLRCHVLQLGKYKLPLWHPRLQPCSSPHTKASTEVIAA